MLFILFYLLFMPQVSTEQVEEILKNMQEGHNKLNPNVFITNFSEKAKEKIDQKQMEQDFKAQILVSGDWVSHKITKEIKEKNTYEIEVKFRNYRSLLKLVLTDNGKVDNYEFFPLKKVDFEDPKIASKKLSFPFKGTWIVKEGGNNLEKNIFKDSFNMAFALYFQKVNEKGEVIESKNQEVLSPIDANVWQIIDNIDENQAGKPNKFRPNGNSIVLKLSSEEYLAITFLKAGSFKVKPGQKVKKDDLLALSGFSGDIKEPMVGLWVQSNVLEQEGEGIKFYFSCVEKFNGKNWQRKEDYFPEKGDILRACSN